MVGKGKVYLIGAGPGDPELLTLKALKSLKNSDVILYDALIDYRLIDELKKLGKKMIYVGKRSWDDGKKRQEYINSLLKELTDQGLTVARLKGGDPLIFGRGCIEIEFLEKENIPYEVIPGVSSINGVPSSCAIPLTHPELSSSILVVSGRADVMRWCKAPLEGTIVVLMGRDTIDEIAKGLIDLGRDKKTPVVAIENGTLPNQRIIVGTLSDIGEKVKRANVKGPLLIVIGEVVEKFCKKVIANAVRTE
uniref:uroporphyrinogen-III C-methyltransferase n=1 Tax=Geoglobus ahangari TaxID=113653 RepID=A0A7C3UKC9_9EURY